MALHCIVILSGEAMKKRGRASTSPTSGSLPKKKDFKEQGPREGSGDGVGGRGGGGEGGGGGGGSRGGR